MENSELLKAFFLKVIDDLKTDAAAKGQKIPLSSFRFEADAYSGQLWGADYFKYLITGRGPGKFPPPDAMLKFVQANPDILQRAKAVYKFITEKQLAFLIGRKIAREGTAIWSGKKQGIDFIGVLDKQRTALVETIAKNELIKIQTAVRAAIK